MQGNPFDGVEPAVQQFMQIMYNENERILRQLRHKHEEVKRLKMVRALPVDMPCSAWASWRSTHVSCRDSAVTGMSSTCLQHKNAPHIAGLCWCCCIPVQIHAAALKEKTEENERLLALVNKMLLQHEGAAVVPGSIADEQAAFAGQTPGPGQHLSTTVAGGPSSSVRAAIATQPGNNPEQDVARQGVQGEAVPAAPARPDAAITATAGSPAHEPAPFVAADTLAAVQSASTKRPRSPTATEQQEPDGDEACEAAAAAATNLPPSKRANWGTAFADHDGIAAAAAGAEQQAQAAAAAAAAAAATGRRPLPPGMFTLSPGQAMTTQQSTQDQQHYATQAPPSAVAAAGAMSAQVAGAGWPPAQRLSRLLQEYGDDTAAGPSPAGALDQGIERAATSNMGAEEQDAASLLHFFAAAGNSPGQEQLGAGGSIQGPAAVNPGPAQAPPGIVASLHSFVQQHSGHVNNTAAGSSGGGAAAVPAMMPQFGVQPMAGAPQGYGGCPQGTAHASPADVAAALAEAAAATASRFAPSHFPAAHNMQRPAGQQMPAHISNVAAVLQRLLPAEQGHDGSAGLDPWGALQVAYEAGQQAWEAAHAAPRRSSAGPQRSNKGTNGAAAAGMT